MITVKKDFEFDCGSESVSAVLTGQFRRPAFASRPQKGMPRAMILSVLAHCSIAAAVCLQLVPAQFIRMPGGAAQDTLDVLLIDAPLGGLPGPPGPPAPAALPQPAPPQPKQIEPIQPKPAAPRKKISHAPARHQPPEPAAAHSTEQTEAAQVPQAAQTGSAAAAAATGGSAAGSENGPPGGAGGGPYETSFGQSDAPRFIHYAPPRYPLAARQQGVQGTVVLRLTIDEHGGLVQAEVVSSPSDGFARSALEAMRRSSFAPAQRSGRPVACRALLPVRFSLK